jgi:dTDP-4-dehydrorhamnose reductase
MKVLITGATGQLGTDLCSIITDCELIPLSHSDIEIIDQQNIRNICRCYKPDVIINTAAYVRVDDCEENQDEAYRVNALGVRNIAVVANELDIKVVHISTDYVFGGNENNAAQPFTEFAKPFPVNIYGKSKLAGENYISHLCSKYFIIRTSGLFGIAGSSGKGGNFINTIVKLVEDKRTLTVVSDQVFSPTYTPDLAYKISQLMRTEYYGIFHITNRGSCSWYEFAHEIIKLLGATVELVAISSDRYSAKAVRPSFSVLDNYHLRLLGMDDLPVWQNALNRYMVQKGFIKPMEDNSSE